MNNVDQQCNKSIQSFVNKDYYGAYEKLYNLLKKKEKNEKIYQLLALYAKVTGCNELAEFYIKETGKDQFLTFSKQHPELLRILLFEVELQQKWKQFQRNRNINEINRFGVTSPLCSGDVLEVGCGNGDLSSIIAMHADRLFGIDIDPVAIELARFKAYQNGLDNCNFTLGDATKLNFNDDCFDTVVLAEVLEHVRSPERFIEEAIRVCKPQGRIIISVPKGYSIPDPDHVRIYTKESLLKLIQSYNQEFNFIREVPSPWILGYITNKKKSKNSTNINHNLTDHFLSPYPLQPIDDTEKVTIILPTYNRCDLLTRSLESVLAQTYHNKEIIVVNDGSTDGTEEVLSKYKDRITYLKKENGGLSSAVNLAIPKASGKYIWVFADDDIALPKKLELQVRKFQENEKVGLVHTSAIFMEEIEGQTVYKGMWHARQTESKYQLKEKLNGNFYFSPTVLVKKEVFDKVGTFDERLIRAQDYDMWVRISRYYHVTAIPVPTVHYLFKQHANDSEIAKKTKLGEQIIIQKARHFPLEEVFIEDGYDHEILYKVESLLERAGYMAHHGLIEEFTEDIERAKELANGKGYLNFTLKGLQTIVHLKNVVNQFEASDASIDLNYFIEMIEKANK